jgi:prepilin-type N-terminal cleavage/methylation domain-containing protein
MHFGDRLQGSPFDYGRPEGVSVRERHTNLKARRGGDQARGFSMIEMCVVLAISLVIASIAVIQIQPALQQVRADTAKDLVMTSLRQARETAISDRRDIQVEFLTNPPANPPGNYVRLTRIGGPCCANTVISFVAIPGSVVFTNFVGEPDTPDAFGNNAPVVFNGVANGPASGMMYQSDGTFVSGTGTPINGSVFIGIPNLPGTARAVTVLGATGRIRAYHISGQSTWFD